LKEIPVGFEDFELIYSYSRKQAIADGVLIDVSEQARETGFKILVAVTDHLYNGYVVPSNELEEEGQSVEERLHDLFMMTQAAAANRWKDDRVYYEVLRGPYKLYDASPWSVLAMRGNLSSLSCCLRMNEAATREQPERWRSRGEGSHHQPD